MKVFIDTTIPMYASGKQNRYKNPCREILARIAEGSLDAATDAEVFQEILYRYYYIQNMTLGKAIFREFRIVMNQVLSVSAEDIFYAEEILDKYPKLKPRDALHAAVMSHNGIGEVLTADRDFDQIPELTRIDPLDFLSQG